MESWNCVLEFLWEPSQWVIKDGSDQYDAELQNV